MKTIKSTIKEISENFINLSEKCSIDIELASDAIIQSIESGGKIMFCGNGGSASDSQHLSAELVGRYKKNRKPFASVALTTDTSAITAISNDFSFSEIFSRQIQAIGKKEDVLYAISTSGKSMNIINALIESKKSNIKTIGVSGINQNKDFDDLCDILISVPSARTDRIQEMHIAVGHIICEIIENKLC